ncbi:MAG: STAS domain-containing protein [bacterium]|nr:STAS domain-containing protein [bacterium]
MNIQVEIEGQQATVYISGTIDIPGAEKLKISLLELANKELEEVVLDFNDVDSIGSSGIGALLLSHKEFQSKTMVFRIINLNKEIRALFKIIKLDKIIKI